MDDPLHPIKEKLEAIHEDVKGVGQQLNDRMDREVKERAWSLVGIRQAIHDLEQRLVSWWRGKE